MTKWFEIFRTGTHKDSAGAERTWTEADLDTIVSKYNPSEHEAPIVIGHPEINAPAWGWIARLKRVGQVLMAKPKDVVPEFAEMVKRGLFKKRSMSVYEDMTLRHVGFLGAMPPAVKGLSDIRFTAADKALTIEFDEFRVPMIGRILQRIREFIIDKFDTDTADKVVAGWEIEDLQRDLTTKDEITAFSEEGKKGKEEEDMEKITELETKIKQLEQSVSSYAEKDKTKEQELAALRKDLDKERLGRRRQDFNAFCDGLVVEGKLTPAQKAQALDFMEILQGSAEYEFAEGDGKVKKQPLEAFKTFLTALPKQVEFSEAATKKKASTITGKAGEKIEALIQEKLKADKALNYSDAFSLVQRENPQLAEEYATEIKG